MALTAALLGAGVILIAGNTIRLDILNRRIEIEVMKLVGASDSFARRPFLYSGIWYGLGGGLTPSSWSASRQPFWPGPSMHLPSSMAARFIFGASGGLWPSRCWGARRRWLGLARGLLQRGISAASIRRKSLFIIGLKRM